VPTEQLRVGSAEAVLIQEPGLPLVATNIRIAAGSRDDPENRHGIAHIVEHLMFSGTTSLGRSEHARLIERNGGFLNAKTSADWTTYLHVTPSDMLGTVLELELARFSETIFTERSLDADKAIVLQERFQRVSVPAYGDATERLLSAVYLGRAPYSHLPVGDKEGVAAATIEECRDFVTANYHAGNMRMIVLGGFDMAVALRLVPQLLAAFPDLPKPAPRSAVSVVSEKVRLELNTNSKDRVFMAISLPPMSDPDLDLAQMGAVLLSHGLTAVLTRRLVGDLNVAKSVRLRAVPRQWSASMGVIELAPQHGVSVHRVIDEFDHTMDNLVRKGADEHDSARARSLYLASWSGEDDSLMQRADSLSLALQVEGTIDSYLSHLQRIRSLTAEHFSRAVAMWHQPTSRVELAYVR